MKKSFVILSVLVFTGCASHGPIQKVDLGAAVTANTEIKKHVNKAQTDINTVLADKAVIARPDLTMDLRDASTELAAADFTIASQKQDLATSQKQADAAVAQGNSYYQQLVATFATHKRDIQAFVVLWILCSLACIFGPLVFKVYPALVFFPTFLEATVCSVAGGLACAAIVGLMVLFGVL